MGNTTSSTPGSVNVCFADYEAVFNMQQNTFANSMFLDIRSEIEYNKSHIDQSHHVKFANKLLSLNQNKTSKEYILYKKWIKQIVKLHQSTYCKTKITFYIVHDNDKHMNLIQNTCQWLNDLYYDKLDNIKQIETSQYYYVNFASYKSKYPFMCSDNKYYEEGRLFPSQITNNIYLCNWGIASDGCIFKILNNIKYVINVTCDHPNIYNINHHQKSIYSQQFLKDIAKSMVIKGDNNEEKKQNISNDPMFNPMFKRQNEKIIELRNEYEDIRLNYFRVPVVDNPSNNIMEYFQQCCNIIETTIKNKNQILIHCRHGQSRSATITAAWLIYKKDLTVHQSLQFIKNKRPRINPNDGFIKQLNDWYKQCQENKHANKTAFVFPEREHKKETKIQIQKVEPVTETITDTDTATHSQVEIQMKTGNECEEKESNISEQLNKSVNIQNEQKNVSEQMNDMEAKIKLLMQKKNEKNETNEIVNVEENVSDNNKDEKKSSDSNYYLYPSTDKKEAEKYNPEKIDDKRIKEITNKMDGNVVNGSSKWNNGATMETFDYTEWMKKRLGEILMDISFNEGIKIYDMVNVDGCATILLVRKQYKFGYDITFECKWKGEVNGNICQGVLKMDDITNDEDINECLYEVSVNVDSEENEYGMGIMKNGKDVVISGINKLIEEFYLKKKC